MKKTYLLESTLEQFRKLNTVGFGSEEVDAVDRAFYEGAATVIRRVVELGLRNGPASPVVGDFLADTLTEVQDYEGTL